jgi:hypothetical protein
MTTKQLYQIYIAIGILYVVIKIVSFLSGYLHLGAIWHGLIPAVLTTTAGIIAMQNAATHSQKTFWRWGLSILPILVLVITPPFMYWKQGALWLANGRLPVLFIYECLALAQIAVAFEIKRQDAREN